MARNDTHGEQVLPSGWLWTTIGEITLPVEKVQPREQPRTRFTYLDISSIDNSVNKVVSPKTFFGEEAPSRARQLVRASDVLFSTVRPYLKNIALVPEVYDGQIATTGLSVLRAATGIPPKYLFYYTLTDKFSSSIGELQRGTSYPAVRDGDVRAQSIPLPPTAEQLRIVDEIEKHFSRLEVAESLLKGIQVKCQRYRASVLEAAYEGQLVPTEADLARAEGRGYEPASQLVKHIVAERRARWELEQWDREIEKAQQEAAKAARKAAGRPLKRGERLAIEEWKNIDESEYGKYLPENDDWKQKYTEPEAPATADLPELPEGWTWTTAEQLSDETRPITYGVIELGAPVGDGVPTLRSSDVRHLRLDLENVKRISSEIARDYERTSLQGGEVLVTVRGSLGGVVVVPEECKGFNISREVAMIALVEKAIGPAVALFVGSRSIQDWLLQRTRGIAYIGINIATLKKTPIPLPPLDEQRRIVNEVERQLSGFAEAEASVVSSLARTRRLRQSILERAFNGQLVSQDAAEEPVVLLLERIGIEKAELEQEQEANQRAKRKKAREARRMARRAKQRRTLWEVLLEAPSQVTPEELFQDAGFDREKIEEIDEFFDELAMEVDRGRIKETRPNKADVFLEAVSHET